MRVIGEAIARAQRPVAERAEPGSLRPYTWPDSAARIDWRASARRAGLFVRTRSRAVQISWSALVDASPSMKARSGLLAVAEEAGALWRACARSGDSWLGTRYGSGALQDSLIGAMSALPARCALLCVGDFYDLPATPRALLRIFGRRFDCTALVAGDAEVIAGRVHVRDAETGKVLGAHVTAAQLLRYARASAEREDAVLAQLRADGWRAARLQRGRAAESLLHAFGRS